MDPSSRCHYEVIMVDTPAKLYLDLEFCKLSNENKNGEEAVGSFLKALFACIEFFYGIKISLNEVLTLDARLVKYSSASDINTSINVECSIFCLACML
ncbi:unnamed protein product [Trichobilharzia regenti]|nr:unnamed protein product [Trichobilharzia regenti]